MTTTLPSFVELMASLGLDSSSSSNTTDATPSSSSRAASPPQHLAVPSSSGPTRSKSSPSLRDQASPRSKGARYSPYASTFVSARRGSVSSLSSSSSSPDMGRMSLRAISTSPHPPSSPRLRKRVDNHLTVNVFGSSTDLSANTPISSFVRRKTPGASPTSPIFLNEESPATSPMPFILPTIPILFPQSADSDLFPVTSDGSDSSSDESRSSRRLSGRSRDLPLHRRSRRRTGVRISTPPRSADLSGKYANRRIVPVI